MKRTCSYAESLYSQMNSFQGPGHHLTDRHKSVPVLCRCFSLFTSPLHFSVTRKVISITQHTGPQKQGISRDVSSCPPSLASFKPSNFFLETDISRREASLLVSSWPSFPGSQQAVSLEECCQHLLLCSGLCKPFVRLEHRCLPVCSLFSHRAGSPTAPRFAPSLKVSLASFKCYLFFFTRLTMFSIFIFRSPDAVIMLYITLRREALIHDH